MTVRADDGRYSRFAERTQQLSFIWREVCSRWGGEQCFWCFHGSHPHQTCKSYLHICNFWIESQVIFLFLRKKIFLKIPVLAKINPCEIPYSWPFAKIHQRKTFRGWHSRKLIHAKINSRKVYKNNNKNK